MFDFNKITPTPIVNVSKNKGDKPANKLTKTSPNLTKKKKSPNSSAINSTPVNEMSKTSHDANDVHSDNSADSVNSKNVITSLSTINPMPTTSSANTSQPTTIPPTTTIKQNIPIVGEFKTEGEYVIVRLSNPHAGKEGDLIPFYSPDYFDLLQIPHPEIYINDNNNHDTPQQNGGGENDDSITSPYKYFKYALDNNPFSRIFKSVSSTKKQTNTPEKNTSAISVSFPSPPPITKNENVANILSIIPTQQQNIRGTILPNTQLFNATPESINPISPSPPPQSQNNAAQTDMEISNSSIILKFYTSNITSFMDISKERNADISTDITPRGLKYKEIEKMMHVMKKKGIKTVSFDELFYLDDILIILKGMTGHGLYNGDRDDIIDLTVEIKPFPNTKINKYPFNV